MLATNPIQIDGQTFDRYSLNLAITGKYNGDGSTDAHVAMRLIPTRIEDGQVITADAHARGICAWHPRRSRRRDPASRRRDPSRPPRPTCKRKDSEPWP
jgi:hypothetical protein